MHTPDPKGGFNFNDLKAFIVENRNGSGQVSSEKAYFKTPTIATRQKAQSPKVAQLQHFLAKQKPPTD
jgi:hypothetical protein